MGAAFGALTFWGFKVVADAVEAFDGRGYSDGIRLVGLIAMGLVSIIVAKVIAPSRSHWVSGIATLSYSLVITISTFFPENDFPIGKLTLLSSVLVLMLIQAIS